MKTILVYTGHCEIVGGDAKYILELINHLHKKYKIILYTDHHVPFAEAAKKWLSVPVEVHQLPTFPNYSKQSLIERFSGWLEKKSETSMLRQAFNKIFFGRSLIDIVSFLYRWFSLGYVVSKIRNAIVLGKLLSKYYSSIDVFWFNNGGYPGKEAGIFALFWAKLFRVQRIIMTVHNVPAVRKWFRPSDFIYDSVVNWSCDTVIAVSENLRRDLESHRKLKNVSISYCGLDDIPCPPREVIEKKKGELKVPEENVILLMCGHLDERRKGHEFLLSALKPLERENLPFRVLFVGRGTEERNQELRQYTHANGLSERVSFLGPRSDIIELNALSDICVVPSLGNEATPYTLKEAMRACKPVVTTSAGGCPEAVMPGKSGLVVKPNDTEELTGALRQLISDADLRREFGKEGRSFYVDRFSMDSAVRAHMEFVER